jgi:DNA-binding response OmpR family regulator
MQEQHPHVLLVDDDPAVLGMVSDALSHFGITVHAFSEGGPALALLEDPASPPIDMVLSDINMDGMDGFDVILRVKHIQSNMPVVLMTGQASLEYAVRAMRMGAANLFQKPLALRELVKNVFHLVEMHREFRLAQDGLKGLLKETRYFSFRCEELDIGSLVRHLTDRLVPMGFASPTNVDVICMAFHEALVNSLEHGNLELDSSMKSDVFSETDPYTALRLERLSDEHFASRTVDVFMEATPDRFVVTITDQGPGFDTSCAKYAAEDSLHKQTGRGLAMIQMVMDEVTFNECGNRIRLVLKKKP